MKVAASLGMIVLFTTGFFGLDKLLCGRRFYDVSCALDRRVPLRPRWIWAYLLYYPLCVAPLFFPGLLDDDALFLRAAAGYCLQFAAAWVIFILFPTNIPRGEVPGDSPSARAVRGLYAVDSGYPIFPSLHVANSIYVACLAARLLPADWAALFFAAAALVSASTVLIKQHYLADIPAGALLGLAAFALAFFNWNRLG
ncbi:MAG: phosphatase PAP2 family protein [Elusimicrobiota bacterium]|nr:MAG: phosphatase PAP2 family protein [Elusimicrobiota bacterium]